MDCLKGCYGPELVRYDVRMECYVECTGQVLPCTDDLTCDDCETRSLELASGAVHHCEDEPASRCVPWDHTYRCIRCEI